MDRSSGYFDSKIKKIHWLIFLSLSYLNSYHILQDSLALQAFSDNGLDISEFEPVPQGAEHQCSYDPQEGVRRNRRLAIENIFLSCYVAIEKHDCLHLVPDPKVYLAGKKRNVCSVGESKSLSLRTCTTWKKLELTHLNFANWAYNGHPFLITYLTRCNPLSKYA